MRSKFAVLLTVFGLVGLLGSVSPAVAASGYEMVVDIYDVESNSNTRVGILVYYDDSFPQEYVDAINTFAPLLVGSISDYVTVAVSKPMTAYEVVQLFQQAIQPNTGSLGWDYAFAVVLSEMVSSHYKLIELDLFQLSVTTEEGVFHPYEYVGTLLINEDYLTSIGDQQGQGGQLIY